MSQRDELTRLNSLLDRVKDFGPAMTRMTGDELRGLRHILCERQGSGQTVELAMAEAFSAVVEAARRTTGRSYRDSDIMAGAALYSGRAVQSDDNGCNHFVALLALRAREWYRRGKDYQIVNAGIVFNTESGSRLPGLSRPQEGILQAIEAREGLATSPEMAVWARMTVSDYFRTYTRLAGISARGSPCG